MCGYTLADTQSSSVIFKKWSIYTVVITVLPPLSSWLSFAFLSNRSLIPLPAFRCLSLELNPSPSLHIRDPSTFHQEDNIPHSLCKWWLLSVINLSHHFPLAFYILLKLNTSALSPMALFTRQCSFLYHPQSYLTVCLPTFLFYSTYKTFQSHQCPSCQTDQYSLIVLASTFTLYLLFYN